ncbi:MAG TPA: hypothetical protein VHI77_08840 [Solirubrobacterales bacterium]|jgi:hypothetical protein|nr:hypothetical protein [Solirubrobacterales bacterium]
MIDRDDIPLSEEEMALARKGEELIRAEMAQVQAPQSLREGIEAERSRSRRPVRPSFWRRYRLALVPVAAVAAVLVVVVMSQSGGGAGEPTYADVEAAAALSRSTPAPASIGGDPPVLEAAVGPIDFPDWRKKFGWRAVGSREDRISGRPVTTVFYRNQDGAELGYAIVHGDQLHAAPPGHAVRHEGNTYHVSSQGSNTVVRWNQQGHTCVMVASAKVPVAKLVELAASRNV